MSRKRIAIDAWASYISPEGAKLWPEEFHHIFRKYRSPDIMVKGQAIESMIAEMDAAGVDRVVLSAFYHKDVAVVTNDQVAALVGRYPDRFVGAGTVNVLRRPMEIAREVELDPGLTAQERARIKPSF